LDIRVQADAKNAEAVSAALAKFGAPMGGLNPADFTQPGSFFRVGREPVAVDILSGIPGIDFDDAWERRVERVIDPATGLKVNFISAGDPITAKLAAGRPQDIADVAAIRKAAESQHTLPEGGTTRAGPSGSDQ
jgi:hypothetical protein